MERRSKSSFTELNKTHPNLKFTHESSKEKISFLDLSIILSSEKLHTDLHIKAIDCHQYVEYNQLI